MREKYSKVVQQFLDFSIADKNEDLSLDALQFDEYQKLQGRDAEDET